MSEGSSTAGAAPRELTPRALVLGVLLGAVMGVANVYLGLLAGMTVSASIPAAVISMGVLRGLFKDASVRENNIVQTVASAGESLAAGIIFTIPALIITGVWTDFDYWTTTLVAMTGGLFGVLFMIPLRKPMIVEDQELTYPEGVACAKVLTAGDGEGAKSGMGLIFGAMGVGALIKLFTDTFGAVAGVLQKGYFSLATGPALLGVGFIVGPNIGTLVFLGGALSWLAIGPLLVEFGYQNAEVPSDAKPHLRMVGVGAMVVGGLWSILMIRNGIRRGLQETLGGYRASMRGEARTSAEESDMPASWILLLLAATSVAVLGLYHHVTGAWAVSSLATVLMVVCSFFFVAVAAYIVGLVGSSNSPVSGMTICSVLFTSLFIWLFGFEGNTAILATLGVAGVVCCATCTSGDVCQDLKTGALVRATPRNQQWAEVLGVISAAFVMQPALMLLHQGYGIVSDAHLAPERQGNALEAPQAQLFAGLMNGFFGEASLPWLMIAIGAGVGLAIILTDQLVLKPRGSSFRLHVMPVAVGMYLPLLLTSSIFLGGLLAWLAGRGARSSEARAAGHEKGILLASGLIAGEAIAGVLGAIPPAMEISTPTLLEEGSGASLALGAGVLVAMSLWLHRVARPKNT